MNRKDSYTRKGKTTATVSYHRQKRVADKVANDALSRGNSVARGVSHYCDPKTGERGRLHVVTVRPPSAWQNYAQQHSGYGVK